jgi:hypothetical protein
VNSFVAIGPALLWFAALLIVDTYLLKLFMIRFPNNFISKGLMALFA